MDKGLILGEENLEIEILQLKAGGNSYGIDINDIREILLYDQTPRKIPNSHPYIEGVVMPRDFLIPVINLAASLNLYESEEAENEMLIVTNIKDMNIGFHVDEVRGIHKTTVANITEPGEYLSTSVREAIAGVLNIDGKTLEILDLRKIISNVNPHIEL